jgi:hypothetical protein
MEIKEDQREINEGSKDLLSRGALLRSAAPPKTTLARGNIEDSAMLTGTCRILSFERVPGFPVRGGCTVYWIFGSDG